MIPLTFTNQTLPVLYPGVFPTIHPALIAPLSDVDTLLLASGTPASVVPSVSPVTVTPAQIAPVVTPEISPNVAIVQNAAVMPVTDAGVPAAGSDKTILLVAAAGIAVLLLMKKKKSVSGITGIGKNKKSSIIPLLLVGGAAAYYFYNQSQGALTVLDAAANPAIIPPAPLTIPVTGGSAAIPQPPPIVTPVEVATIARGYTAATDENALSRDWPAMMTTMKLMTDTEIIQLYNYFYGYVLPGKKLYRLPGATGIFPDGGWDTALYDAIAAIKTKYSINI